MNQPINALLIVTLLALSPLAVFATEPADRPEPQTDAQYAPAIGGYSPVSYFTSNKPELGSSDYVVSHGGKTYHLTSQAQVELFNLDPDKYRPRYEVCPFGLTEGLKLQLDPTNFKVVGGYLLLFHKSPEIDGLANWNKSRLTQQELLNRADNQITLLRF